MCAFISHALANSPGTGKCWALLQLARTAVEEVGNSADCGYFTHVTLATDGNPLRIVVPLEHFVTTSANPRVPILLEVCAELPWKSIVNGSQGYFHGGHQLTSTEAARLPWKLAEIAAMEVT